MKRKKNERPHDASEGVNIRFTGLPDVKKAYPVMAKEVWVPKVATCARASEKGKPPTVPGGREAVPRRLKRGEVAERH